MNHEEEYRKAFKGKEEEALKQALDIRKFEIGLYWQRAAYFWALIAVAFAGYFAILSAEHLADKEYLAYIVGCIGLIFTWAWFLVNRGSKYWQENWENHVDLLEDEITGPLYKTVLARPPETEFIKKYFIGPLAISVSKTNQWVSSFVLCIWLMLVARAVPGIRRDRHFIFTYGLVALVTVLFAYLMLYEGKTFEGSYGHVMRKRRSHIL